MSRVIQFSEVLDYVGIIYSELYISNPHIIYKYSLQFLIMQYRIELNLEYMEGRELVLSGESPDESLVMSAYLDLKKAIAPYVLNRIAVYKGSELVSSICRD